MKWSDPRGTRVGAFSRVYDWSSSPFSSLAEDDCVDDDFGCELEVDWPQSEAGRAKASEAKVADKPKNNRRFFIDLIENPCLQV